MTPTQEALVELAALPESIRVRLLLDAETGCWNWIGGSDPAGRGRMQAVGRSMLHHRGIWTLLRGPIPANAMLCHHCDNPRCANPDHLYVGDGKTNARDMFSRGRHWTQREPERASRIGRLNGLGNTWSRGAGNPKAKLSPDQVAAITASTEKTKVLAARHGVNRTTIQRIRRGAAWN